MKGHAPQIHTVSDDPVRRLHLLLNPPPPPPEDEILDAESEDVDDLEQWRTLLLRVLIMASLAFCLLIAFWLEAALTVSLFIVALCLMTGAIKRFIKGELIRGLLGVGVATMIAGAAMRFPF